MKPTAILNKALHPNQPGEKRKQCCLHPTACYEQVCLICKDLCLGLTNGRHANAMEVDEVSVNILLVGESSLTLLRYLAQTGSE